MKNTNETYIGKSYSINHNLAVTYLLCGALIYNGGLLAANKSIPLEKISLYGSEIEKQGSKIQDEIYKIAPSTWSPLKNVTLLERKKSVNSKINVENSLNIISKLAFLPVDEKIDKEVELYFASKPVKTKTIFLNNRIHKG